MKVTWRLHRCAYTTELVLKIKFLICRAALSLWRGALVSQRKCLSIRWRFKKNNFSLRSLSCIDLWSARLDFVVVNFFSFVWTPALKETQPVPTVESCANVAIEATVSAVDSWDENFVPPCGIPKWMMAEKKVKHSNLLDARRFSAMFFDGRDLIMLTRRGTKRDKGSGT